MEENEGLSLTTYVINLIEREDRLSSILAQFANRPEFNLKIRRTHRHQIGAVGLWENILWCIADALSNDEDVIVICEDDHTFTKSYTSKFFFDRIFEAYDLGCDILSGGIGGFNYAVPVSEDLLWIDYFWCTQFIVIYKPFFQRILDAPYDDTVTADHLLSVISTNKMVIHPFVSVQYNFGYSDVTKQSDDNPDNINEYFRVTESRISVYNQIFRKYKSYNQFQPLNY